MPKTKATAAPKPKNLPLHAPTLALDVGFRHTGWAVLKDGAPVAHGCIHGDTSKRPKWQSQTDADMIAVRALAHEVLEVAREYRVHLVVAEMPGGAGRGARALSCMSMAKATIGVALREYPCVWQAPRRTKSDAATDVAERWPRLALPSKIKDREHILDALSAWLQYEFAALAAAAKE